MATNKIETLEAFNEWVRETFGRPTDKLNWNFADGKYVKLFDGPPNATNFWMWREFLRLYRHPQTGVSMYKPPVWAGKLDPIANHFLHVAIGDETLVAYTPNPEKGVRDVSVTTKPGKYLQKFYPSLTEEQIRLYANEHRDLYSNEDVAFACTADEVEHVYLHGPSSCMKKAANQFTTGIQPVRVYGESPDIVLAYLDRDKGISGRALMDISQKPPVFSRVYGDMNLKTKLERMGFRYVGDGQPMTGTKLKIVKDDFGRIIMPYVDWCGVGRVDNETGLITLNKSGGERVSLQNTAGYIEKTYQCPTCNGQTSGASMMYHEVHNHSKVPGCASCFDNRAIVQGLARGGNAVNMLRAEASMLKLQDGTEVYFEQGVEPADLGLVMFGKGWVPESELIDTVNRGKVWSRHTQTLTLRGGLRFVVEEDAMSNLSLDDFVVGRVKTSLSTEVLYKPDRSTLVRDRGSLGEMARYGISMGLTLAEVFDWVLPSGVNTASLRRLGRLLWNRDYSQAWDAADSFLPDVYEYPKEMLDHLDVAENKRARKERLSYRIDEFGTADLSVAA